MTDVDILNPEPEGKIKRCLQELSLEGRELYISTEVPVLQSVPSPLEFYREWVSANMPVIIRGAIKHWPAVQKWTHAYLREQLGNKNVTVAVTPNGYADAPKDGYFVMPEERSVKFGDFLGILENPSKFKGVFYIQKQNSNFTEEFVEIANDAELEIPWFSEALGKSPDAANFWMGDKRAVTSMHKDNYENIYCVIVGYKDFILLPPSDLPWVPYKCFPTAYYKETSCGKFEILPDSISGTVPWICIDPLNPDLQKYPQYKQATPIQCQVHAGDALYLPSLWFHHVRQSHGCIAVNYWYDMEYDLKYNYYKLLQNLTWTKDPLRV